MTAHDRLDAWLAGAPRTRTWALLVTASLASGALFATCAHLGLAWILFFAPIPWLFALDRAPSLRHAIASGIAMSVAFTAMVLPWFPAAVGRYTGLNGALSWAVYLVLAPFIQPQMVVFAVARRLLVRERTAGDRLRAALGGALSWVAVESVFPKLFFDTLGQGLYPSPWLRQAADLAGTGGLTIGVLWVSEALLWTVTPQGRGEKTPLREWQLLRFGPLGAALFGVVVWVAYGAYRVHALSAPATASIDVGVVQANITAYEKLRAEKGAFETVAYILDTHVAMSDEVLQGHRPDLLVWPETVYPTTFGSPKSEAGETFDRAIEAFSATRRVPLVFGAYEAEDGLEYNAAFFLTPEGEGRPTRAVYRKRMLFPLTEWVPPAIDGPRLRAWFPWLGTWSRGPGAKVISVTLPGKGAVRVAPMICYDAVSPDLAAEGARSGAQVLVTLSNDSWFPDERAPEQHLVSAAFRSIETGLAQVRATNSGVSAVISRTGDIEGRIPWNVQKTMVARVALSDTSPPPAVTWGPRLGGLGWGATALLLADALKRRRSKKEGEKESKKG